MIIKAKDVSYTSASFSLSNLNFTISEGEYISLLGANGSGKSTLLRIIDLILPIKSGSLEVFSIDSRDLKRAKEARSKISFIFQNPTSSMINKYVLDEVMFAPLNYGERVLSAKKMALKTLERFGLSGFENRRVSDLSNGERQRLAIASAFVTEPKLLILDEAFTYLDRNSKELLINALAEERAKGTTIISVTHDARLARLAERVIVLKEGQIIKDGKRDEVLSDVELLLSANIRPLDEDLYSWRLYDQS